MKSLVIFHQLNFSFLGALTANIIGAYDGFLKTLIIFIIIDYLTGLMAAVVERKMTSAIGFKGIFKKVVLLSLVAVGYLLDTHVLKQDGLIRGAVIFFYLSNEGISILENAGRIGLPIPGKLKTILAQLNTEKKEK